MSYHQWVSGNESCILEKKPEQGHELTGRSGYSAGQSHMNSPVGLKIKFSELTFYDF